MKSRVRGIFSDIGVQERLDFDFEFSTGLKRGLLDMLISGVPILQKNVSLVIKMVEFHL